MTGFMMFCLISPHIPSPTRKWKARPYGTCFLSSDGFVYTPPCLPHLHNPKNPVQMAGFRAFYLTPPIFSPPPENGKHAHMGRVFWARMGSLILPHTYSTSTTQETRSEMSGYWVIASSPSYALLTRKLKTRPLRTCFLASGDFIHLPPYIMSNKSCRSWI